MENGNNEKKYKQIPNSVSPGSWWKIFIVFILLYLIGAFFFNSFNNNTTTIPYSVFKNQVIDKNVKKVTIKGQNIKGEFNNSFKQVEKKDTATYKYFTTTIPAIKDPDLLKTLENNNVIISAKEEGNNWITYLIIMGIPWLLIIGYFIFMNRRMKNKMGGSGMMEGGFFGIGKSKAKRFKKEKVSVTFEDVAGLENPKIDLKEIIEYLKTPEKFSKLGADIPKGVLLVGPPGTGKTLLARATAGEADVAFFSISGSEFIEMFVGVGASRVRDMFNEAKKNAPTVIFIDEIDSIGRSRGTGLGGGHDEREQTLNQILSEMDGFEPNQSVVVMAATNRPDILDPALTRPGRFDRRITLDLPMKGARRKILEIHTRKVPLKDDVDLDNIAARTITFSGADIKNLVNEAALLAGRKGKAEVDKEDLDEARDKILLGEEREEVLNEKEKKITAYHEAGHALSAILIPEADPLEKVTVIPRGRSLGSTEQLPETERRNFTKNYLLARIAVALGGRAAEHIVFNDVTNGAASDLKQVTNIARKMVCLWGMSNKLGPVFFNQGEDHMFLGREITNQKDFSEDTQKIIDDEISGIISDMNKKVKKLIEENRTKLDAIAEALIENETLDKKQIEWILEKVESGEEKESYK